MQANSKEAFSKDIERREHMLNDPMRKLIPSVAIPSVISMLVTAVYNMADTYFVGNLGTSASGAVGIVLPIMNLLMAFAFVFAHGAVSYVSRLLGKGETERASGVVTTALVSAVFVGFLYGAGGLLFLDRILTLFGATSTILPFARDYALYIYIAAPFYSGSFALNNTLRAEGSAMKSLIGMSSGAILNIILDPICIFTLNMGVGGAGFATMIGQIIGFCLLMYFYLSKGKHGSVISISLKKFTLEWAMYKELLRVGVPSFFRLGLNSLAAILLNVAAAPYGDAAIAGFSIVTRILMLVANALIGYTQGYQPISGYNYGAGKYRRVEEAYRFTNFTSIIVTAISGLLLIIAAEPLVSIFRADPEVIAVGARTLRYQAATLPLISVSLVISTFFQSTGRAGPSFICAIARQGLCFIPLVLILPKLFGMDGLVAVQACADLFAFLVSVPLMIVAYKDLKKKPDEETPKTMPENILYEQGE